MGGISTVLRRRRGFTGAALPVMVILMNEMKYANATELLEGPPVTQGSPLGRRKPRGGLGASLFTRPTIG
jgi:hypothetical protein